MKVNLAIDFGSANMKMAGIIEKKVIKRIIKSEASTSGTSKLSDKNIVEFNGRTVYFGAGNPLVKKNKTQREFVLESVFLAANAIYGNFDNNFEIQLAMGLPLDKYTSNEKDVYLNELNREFLNKKFNGTVDGKNITIKITYINIYGEGYSGFLAIMNKINTKKPLLIIDVGYKTTDIIGIKYDTFSSGLIVDNYGTIEKGMLEILTDITKQFNHDNIKADYSPETIEYSVINNIDLQVGTAEGLRSISVNKWFKDGENVMSYIFNEIEVKYFPDWKNRNLYFIGGGVKIIKSIMDEIANKDKSMTINTEELKEDEINDNKYDKFDNTLMFANVNGYLIQLQNDTIDIVESEEVFVSDSKLNKSKVTLTGN